MCVSPVCRSMLQFVCIAALFACVAVADDGPSLQKSASKFAGTKAGQRLEWCRDSFVKDLPGGRDPEATVGHTLRVMRGGAWSNSPGVCRSAHRDSHAPDFRDDDVGFRVAAVPSGK